MGHGPFGEHIGGVGEKDRALCGCGHQTHTEPQIGGRGGDEGGSYFGTDRHLQTLPGREGEDHFPLRFSGLVPRPRPH